MRRLREPAASRLKSHQKIDEKTIPTEHGSDNSRKILEREQHFNMKMLQVKGFWRKKRTVSENQLFRLENRTEVATCFYRSGASPAEVSELDMTQRNPDAITRKNYQNRFRYD